MQPHVVTLPKPKTSRRLDALHSPSGRAALLCFVVVVVVTLGRQKLGKRPRRQQSPRGHDISVRQTCVYVFTRIDHSLPTATLPDPPKGWVGVCVCLCGGGGQFQYMYFLMIITQKST